MLKNATSRTLGSFALLGALTTFSASAASVNTVFVIAMENHNWTQPISGPRRDPTDLWRSQRSVH
jgi:hypothetical protein